MEDYYPDPELDTILSKHSKEQNAIEDLERKLKRAREMIENLSRTKRKIIQELGERKKTKNTLVEKAKKRDRLIKKKWAGIAPRYGFGKEGPFSLISVLPNELRVLIFSFLPIRDILFSVAQVSTELNRLVSDNVLWHNLYSLRWKQLKLPRTYKTITELDSSNYDWRTLFVDKYRLESNWKHGRCKTSSFEGHGGIVTCLHFQGDTLVTGCGDRLIRIWNMQDNECEKILEDHTGAIECLQFNKKHGRIISGARDCTLKVWDVETEDVVATLEDHSGWVTCLQFDNSTLVSGSGDNTVKVWDLNVGTCIRTILGHKKFISALQFDGNQLVTGSRDRTIKMWDLRSGVAINSLKKHTSIVECLKFQGDTLVSGGDDRTLQVWSLRTGQCISLLSGHNSWARCLQLSPSLSPFPHSLPKVVSGSDDSTIKIWSLTSPTSPKCQATLRGHQSFVTCLQFKKHRLVSGSVDKTVKLWDFSPPLRNSGSGTS